MTTETWTILKILSWTREYLASKGVENARLEAEWLLCAATGLDRVGLYLNFERPLNETELSAYRNMVARRGRREPLQHILGTQEFFGLEFEVSSQVLIPRHDTETLVTAALEAAPAATRVLDVGTGSGCIAVAIARHLPDAHITAVDISAAALDVAKRNASRNGVQVEFLHGSLLKPVAGRVFDLIVSNPPYIPSEEIARLEPEVKHGDPRQALDGGEDGLDIYRRLVPAASGHLAPGGWLLVEVGAGQAADVAGLFAGAGFGAIRVLTDPGGIERVVGGARN